MSGASRDQGIQLLEMATQAKSSRDCPIRGAVPVVKILSRIRLLSPFLQTVVSIHVPTDVHIRFLRRVPTWNILNTS